jgi:hypothetical protein
VFCYLLVVQRLFYLDSPTFLDFSGARSVRQGEGRSAYR